MFPSLRRWLEISGFPTPQGDERTIKMMDSLSLIFMAMLSITALIFIPFFAVNKNLAWSVAAALILLFVFSRHLIDRGILERSGTHILFGAWAIFAAMSAFSGGIGSPVNVSIIATMVLITLLMDRRIASGILVLSIAVEFIYAFLETEGRPLPNLFVFTPLSTWFWFALSLGFVFATVRLVKRNLREAYESEHRHEHARLQAESVLRGSEARFRAVVENSHDGFMFLDRDARLLYVSPSYARFGSRSPEELTGQSGLSYIHPDDRETVTRMVRELSRSGEGSVEAEFRTRHRDGSWHWVEAAATDMLDDPNVHAVVLNVRSIADRKAAEERIRSSLEEKEILLKELYHRTKNNMQLISSMMSLQAASEQDPHVLEVFREMDDRIRAMSLVHNKLYQSQNLASIDLGAYVSELGDLLRESYAGMGDRVEVRTEAEEIPVHIDAALPCGIVLNELVSNSFKHAFPGGRKGRIGIGVRKTGDGSIELRVEDDGVGLPAGRRRGETGKLGLDTVISIVEMQLRGSIHFGPAPGFECRIAFKPAPDWARA
jgi:PAS domain S-box-containing protein